MEREIYLQAIFMPCIEWTNIQPSSDLNIYAHTTISSLDAMEFVQNMQNQFPL